MGVRVGLVGLVTATALLVAAGGVPGALADAGTVRAANDPVGSASVLDVPGANTLLDIATGPGGTLWLADAFGHAIFRMTPAGEVTRFPLVSTVPAAEPRSIAAGPDGNMWFTQAGRNRIGRITPAGDISEFVLPDADSGPQQIAAGPDGNMWFTQGAGNRIGRITPQGQISQFPLPLAASGAQDITAGPDGNMWFTQGAGHRIGRITMQGDISQFATGAATEPRGIAAGPDGGIWFTELSGNTVRRISPTGTLSVGIPVPLNPSGIAAGPDGALWFTSFGQGRVGRVDPWTGIATIFALPSPVGGPSGIASGPDGAVWLVEAFNRRVNRIATGAVTAAPVLAGSGQVGLPLVCTNATWASPPDTVTIAWRRSGTAIAGESGPSYTPTSADLGAAISCDQSVTLPAVIAPFTAVSNAVTVVEQLSGPAGQAGPPGPPGATGAPGPVGTAGTVGAAGSTALVAVFAPQRLVGRAGARLRVVYAISGAASVTLRLSRGSTSVTATTAARAGTNSVRIRLAKGRKGLPSGRYALALRAGGTDLTRTTVTVTRGGAA